METPSAEDGILLEFIAVCVAYSGANPRIPIMPVSSTVTA